MSRGQDKQTNKNRSKLENFKQAMIEKGENEAALNLFKTAVYCSS